MGWRSWANRVYGFIGVVVAIPILLQLAAVLRGGRAGGGEARGVSTTAGDEEGQFPGDVCGDMARVSLPPDTEAWEEGGYRLSTPSTFTPGSSLTVRLTGKQPFRHYRLQMRGQSESKSFGLWSNVQADDILISCTSSHDTLANLRQGSWKSLAATWSTADKYHHPIKVVALVHDGSTWRKLAAAAIHTATDQDSGDPGGSNSRLVRSKRDTKFFFDKTTDQDTMTTASPTPPNGPTNQKALTTPSSAQGGSENLTKAPTTEKKKAGGIDGNSLFYLLTVIASYVGMYTIFSFLLI